MGRARLDRKQIRVYLCGKMSGLTIEEQREWRIALKNELEKIEDYTTYIVECIDPTWFYNPSDELMYYQSDQEVMEFDLDLATNSDLIVANMEGLNSSIGSQIEIFECARNHKIPVIAMGTKEQYENLYPWTRCLITRVEPDEKAVAEYINSFYAF